MVNYEQVFSYMNEYFKSYSVIDVKGKTVIDIGADVGTSAFYFLCKGANLVIAYSLEPQKIFDDKLVWRKDWKGEYIEGDVFKIDCEGCECLLTKDIIERYPEWYIAIHTFSNCFNPMKEYLETHGQLVFITPDKKEYLYAKSLNMIK